MSAAYEREPCARCNVSPHAPNGPLCARCYLLYGSEISDDEWRRKQAEEDEF